jgi:signal transduction histidine kinase
METGLEKGNGTGPLGERQALLEERVRQKIADYERYSFSTEESRALTIFFDLAQEFNNLDDLYSISVVIPKIFHGFDACIHLMTKDKDFRLVRCSDPGKPLSLLDIDDPSVVESPFEQGNNFIVPIRGNRLLITQLPITPIGEVIGLLEICPTRELTPHEKLYFQKYCNRIGFQIHNKMLNLKNQEHISFIQNLVTDIGHNVIVPNMYYKLLFKQLERRIKDLRAVLDRLDREMDKDRRGTADRWKDAYYDLEEIHIQLFDQYRIISSHFEQTSLFLESLLRRSHFEKGQYVLVKRHCNFKSQIIDPQIERFRSRLQEKGIEIDTSMGGVPDEDVWLAADLGLISQVFANLFSNAVKYTREVRDRRGTPRRFLSYGWEPMQGHFGDNRCAIKLNVFTTGPHISPEDRVHLFEPEFRGSAAMDEYGTGHGLFFVKEIVQLHGGEVGYEPTEMGNNFYIILPCESWGRPHEETGGSLAEPF